MSAYPLLDEDDIRHCGIGLGERCCRYLTVGDGFQCGRENPALRAAIDVRAQTPGWSAQRNPGDAPYPECQLWFEED